jgi:hypothetical protein
MMMEAVKLVCYINLQYDRIFLGIHDNSEFFSHTSFFLFNDAAIMYLQQKQNLQTHWMQKQNS